jgi:hypothetical protein
VAVGGWPVLDLPVALFEVDHDGIGRSGVEPALVASGAKTEAARGSGRLIDFFDRISFSKKPALGVCGQQGLNRWVTAGSLPRWNQDDLPRFGVPRGDFAMLAGENASLLERQCCSVCRGPTQVIRVEAGVPGLPPGRQRQMVKCSACGLVGTHTSISNKNDGQKV